MEFPGLHKSRAQIPAKRHLQASAEPAQKAHKPQKNPAALDSRATSSSKVSTTESVAANPKRKSSALIQIGGDKPHNTKKPRTANPKQGSGAEENAENMVAGGLNGRGQPTGNTKATVEALAARVTPNETFAFPHHVLESKKSASDELRVMKNLARVLSTDKKYKDDFKNSKYLGHLNRYTNTLEGLIQLQYFEAQTKSPPIDQAFSSSAIHEKASTASDTLFDSVKVGVVFPEAVQDDSAQAGQQDHADAETPEANTTQLSSSSINMQEVQNAIEAHQDAQFVTDVNLDSLKDVREKKRLLSIISQRLGEDPIHLDETTDRASRFLNTVDDEINLLDMVEQHHEKVREAEVFGGSLYVKTQRSPAGAAPRGDDVGTGALHDVVRKVWNVEDIHRLQAVKRRAEDAMTGYEGVLDKLQYWKEQKEELQGKKNAERAIKENTDRGFALRVQGAAMVSLAQLADAKIDDIRQRR